MRDGMATQEISIKGLDKAELLAALYNSARTQGRGLLQHDPKPMTKEEAQKILDTQGSDFDYLKGRVMKIDLSGDSVDPWLYDRDNGSGAVERIVGGLRGLKR